jgi:hypothetical protein
MGAYYSSVAFGAILVLIASLSYWKLWRQYAVVFEYQPPGRTLVDLFSHVPEVSAGPLCHVVAGVSLVTGLAALVAAIALDAFGDQRVYLEDLISFTGLMLAISFSSVTLWTLWQTRRIDYQAGYKIFDFRHLIEQLNREIDDLLRSFHETYSGRAQPFHRVYLVTTEPFLGRLSYPHHSCSETFLANLRKLADASALSLEAHGATDALRFEVLCGDTVTIRNFYNNFYRQSHLPQEKIENRVQDTEADIANMNARLAKVGSSGPFYRVSRLPPLQFMVVGNKLFEFTLESQKSMSEIFNTQVVHDTRFCTKYIQTFEIMKDSFCGKAPTIALVQP